MWHMLEMESGKDLETLREGLLELKMNHKEIICSKVREDGSVGCLNNLDEKFVVDACSGRKRSNVEVARESCNGSVEDVITGNNRMKGGDVAGYPDEKLLALMHNDDFPALKGELKCGGNSGDQNVKVEESLEKFDDSLHCDELFLHGMDEVPMEKSIDVLHPHEPGSPTKIEVSGNSINLFVEVFGPLDGAADSNLDHPVECKLGESNFKQELSLEVNGTTLSSGITETAKYEGGGIIGEKERTFDIGDLVWVKTRTQLWWPGMVSDPSVVPNDTTKCIKKGIYLVNLYGSANFIWCENADLLKPFVEYFEQMSGQNNSRSFIGSVERAICEIGLRVQLNMSCPCFSKDSWMLDPRSSLRTREETVSSMQKGTKFDVLSLSQFQPTAFVADIRNLARSILVPGKIELLVIKNHLSSFYRSIGHLELPMQLLRSGSDAAQYTPEHLKSDVRNENPTNISGDGGNTVGACVDNLTGKRRYTKRKNQNVLDDKVTSSGEGFESRGRKKSRYLSYPYVDVINGQKKEDMKKKPKERHIVSKADDISASSVELLAELCSSALDSSYISRSKYSDSLERFYSSFRVFAFLDADTATSKIAEKKMEGSIKLKKLKKQKTKNIASANESIENVVGETSSVAGDQKMKENSTRRRYRKKKEQVTNPEEQIMGIKIGEQLENQKVNLASAILQNADKCPNIENPQVKEDGLCMKSGNERESSIPAGFESVHYSSTMGTSIFPKSSWMISFQQACSTLFKNSKSPKKSVGVTPGTVDTNSTPRLPDLNISHPCSPAGHIPAEGPSANLVNPLPEQNKEEGIVSSPINVVHRLDFASVSSSKDVPPSFQNTLISNNVAMGPYQCLNGNIAAQPVYPVATNTGDSSTIQHSFQMGNFLSACKAEPRRRYRKRKEKTCEVASAIPDLNGNVLDMIPLGTTTPEGSHIPPEGQTQKKRRNMYDSGESVGGSLVLNFSAGSLPSKETLVATFSRFGLLKESELEVLSDDSVKIVYERSSDARFAFRSLEKSHTFGESLVNFNLDCCSPEPIKINKKNNLQLQTFVPVTTAAHKNQAKVGETRDIAFIKQNVEMMKSTLEKAGDKLSPEMRAKLENEIKAFLDKISCVAGSVATS